MGKKSRRNRNKNGGIRSGNGATITTSSENNNNGEQRPSRRILYAPKGRSFRIQADYDGPETSTIYSYGNYPGGAEFIAYGVPANKDKEVVATIKTLSVNQDIFENLTSPVGHGQSWWLRANSENKMITNKHLVTKLIRQGPNKDDLLKKHGIFGGIQNPLFEIIPRFKNKGRPENWGGMASAPEKREDMARDIFHIWKVEYDRSFKLYIDGDRSNDAFTNTKKVDISRSLKHIDDWVTDWDDYLTTEQASFVRTNNRYFSHVAKVLFRPIKMCDYCKLMDDERLVRCQCKVAWYCSPECQIADWPHHKEICEECKLRLDKRPLEICAECGLRDTEKLRLCSVCQSTWYCCEEHQKDHWPSHKNCCAPKIINID